MLHRIYLMCHGETVDDVDAFSTLPDEKAHPTPNNKVDAVLSETGIVQAQMTADYFLEKENLIFDVLYSAPVYQCLETLKPFVTDEDENDKAVLSVRVDYGLREFENVGDLYPPCSEECHHKAPTAIGFLESKFDFIDPDYPSLLRNTPEEGWRCETPHELLVRAHFTIDYIIRDLDQAQWPQNVLICCTAPVLCAIARVLSSNVVPNYSHYAPEYQNWLGEVHRKLHYVARVKLAHPDIHAGHCSFTRFDIRNLTDWRWNLVMNGYQGHLEKRTGFFRFPQSQWQNRYALHPLLVVFEFCHDLPWSLLRIIMLFVSLYHAFADFRTAAARSLRKNPYRLPAWVYTVLFLGLIFGNVLRVNHMRKTGKDCELTPSTRGCWQKTIDEEVPNIMTNLVQLTLFMFPPLLA